MTRHTAAYLIEQASQSVTPANIHLPRWPVPILDNEYKLTKTETILWHDQSQVGVEARTWYRDGARRARDGRGIEAIFILAYDGEQLDCLTVATE
jgi:hypothetical protein